MLENIDLTMSVKNGDYKESLDSLEEELGEIQRQAWELKIPIILVFEGWHASGIAEDINRFILPLDPRGYDFHTMVRPGYEEALKPFLWRFWTKIPVRGKIAIFDRSWYSRAIIEKYGRESSDKALENCLKEINYFERQLSKDGYLILKFFLHISEKEQKERFRKIRKSNIPLIVDEYEDAGGEELDFIHEYSRYLPVVEKVLEITDFPHSPWTIVEANDRKFATLKIFSTVIQVVREHIEKVTRTPGQQTIKYLDISTSKTLDLNGSLLEKTDLSKALLSDEYKKSKKQFQNTLSELQYELFRQKRSLVIVFEGMDAAGKGGDIHRLVQELNPRLYRVIPVGAPNDIEKAHHYLWRFFEGIPKAGHMTIYDRSWYGRVLVERIEGLCSEDEWKRAYREINEFEEVLANSGTIVLKFWLQIDRDTQLKRFESRKADPRKQWKITPEDWRNRERWIAYVDAAEELLQKTSTSYAPWIVVEANDKYYSRIKVLKTVAETLEKELKS
ncbi:hypothetical protein MSMTP_1629 [Methanosarcina sp. MTP4]|uniref:polyphosphate:AMP phosphotransferase n=1 Tax=Methanosarcina sp. MTP4 TaxID=1434100 RepID=UPI0006155683|nr:polyphosphate:AMP phosphotransferase [Methanosarcina sp. MTP4]AKB25098.1 hypothetical protein MSMTP_1629 [Methanosarcina sp. MTP4]